MLVLGFGFGDGALDDGLEAVDVVLRVLPGDVRVGRVGDDPQLAARVVEDAAAKLRSVGEIDEQGAAGVGAVIKAEGLFFHEVLRVGRDARANF